MSVPSTHARRGAPPLDPPAAAGQRGSAGPSSTTQSPSHWWVVHPPPVAVPAASANSPPPRLATTTKPRARSDRSGTERLGRLHGVVGQDPVRACAANGDQHLHHRAAVVD